MKDVDGGFAARITCWYLQVALRIESITPLTADIEVTDDLLNSLSASLNFRFRRSALLFVFLQE